MQKTVKILILVLFLPVLAQANNIFIDSLRAVVPTLQGKEKHFTLTRIAMATDNIADWDATVKNAFAQRDTVSACMAMTNRFICMANRASADSLLRETEKTLLFMRRARQWTYYFSTYQTYIDCLFRERRYDDAEKAASDMYRAAQEEGQPKGMAMALQVQGSMYYRLDLHGKAMESLEEALRICPDYRNTENQTLVTTTLICEWLCMTALKTEDFVKLDTYAGRYTDVVEYRRQVGVGDQAGHFTVTSAAFRAQVLLSQSKIREAERMLDKAQRAILPNIPARAYEHYYEARFRQYTLQSRYREALVVADLLLSAHAGYFPFYLDDMLRKADILARLYRPEESRQLYLRYMQAKDSIERVEIAAHINNLNTQYQIDRLQVKYRASALCFTIALCGAGLLLVLLFAYIFYSRSLRRKNRALYLRIHEQEKMEERVFDAIEILPVENLSKETQLFCHLSERMHEEKLFTRHDLNRKDLATMLGTNENYLACAIRNNTNNKTFREYITDLRLKYAVRLLDENSDMSIEAIGEAVGFNTRTTFFRTFKDRFGMSPNDYRKEANKK